MDKIKKNFGFGCMRFPMIGEKIDEAQAEATLKVLAEVAQSGARAAAAAGAAA